MRTPGVVNEQRPERLGATSLAVSEVSSSRQKVVRRKDNRRGVEWITASTRIIRYFTIMMSSCINSMSKVRWPS